MWNVVGLVSVLLFAVFVVRVRRRHDTEELVAAAAGAAVVLGALIFLAGRNQRDFLYGPAICAMILGVIGGAFITELLAERSPMPDAPIHIVLASVGFGMGALVGFFLGFLFSLQGSAWVG